MIRRVASTLDRLIAGIEAGVVLFALSSLVILTSWQIVMRNLERPAPGWIDPFLHQMVLWAGFLGASLAVRLHGHIRFDLLSRWVSPRVNGWIDLMARLFSAAICLLLARAAWTFSLAERTGEAEIAGVPVWIYTLVIPGAFVLMAVHFLLTPPAAAGETA